MGITFEHTTLGQRVAFGTGKATENIVNEVQNLGGQRVLLIADEFAAEFADTVAAQIPVAVRISDVVQHVPAENARATIAAATEADCDVVVSIGGGSSTGLAKIVGRDLHLPIIAVPTTYAGSEATDVWGMTEGERKTTGVDPNVLPKVVVYDAALLASLPASMATASGLNAVAHAVDGFWAPRADPINRANGAEGIRSLVPALRALHADLDSIDAREQMLYGAYLAAVAFASAGSGMHHKICHVLGGRFGLPHAQMHAVVLGHVTAFNVPEAPDAAERISAAFGGVDASEAVFALTEELGIPRSLAEIGLKEEDIPEAVELIHEVIPPSNPRAVSKDDLRGLLERAWSGRRA